MMAKTSIRKLRSSTKEILNAISRGDTVLITNRGTPCAKIVPLSDEEKTIKPSAVYGMWKDHPKTKSVGKYVKDLRKGRYAP